MNYIRKMLIILSKLSIQLKHKNPNFIQIVSNFNIKFSIFLFYYLKNEKLFSSRFF